MSENEENSSSFSRINPQESKNEYKIDKELGKPSVSSFGNKSFKNWSKNIDNNSLMNPLFFSLNKYPFHFYSGEKQRIWVCKI